MLLRYPLFLSAVTWQELQGVVLIVDFRLQGTGDRFRNYRGTTVGELQQTAALVEMGVEE